MDDEGKMVRDGRASSDVIRPDRLRRPVLACVSYPPSAGELAHLVDALLQQAEPATLPGRPVALLAPHAALIPVPYSGAVAAAAYRQVQGAAIERVIVLAPSHHKHGGAVLLPDVDAYATPLGVVPLDGVLLGEVARRLPDLTRLVVEDKDHAVEIQLPFLWRCLRHFRLVPILFERQGSDCVAAVANALVSLLTVASDGHRTLLVTNSDLSHGHDSTAAGRLDHTFLDLVAELDAEGLIAVVKSRTAEACGFGAVAASILTARSLGARECRVHRYATSGDVTGNHAQVVGYGAAVMVAAP